MMLTASKAYFLQMNSYSLLFFNHIYQGYSLHHTHTMEALLYVE